MSAVHTNCKKNDFYLTPKELIRDINRANGNLGFDISPYFLKNGVPYLRDEGLSCFTEDIDSLQLDWAKAIPKNKKAIWCNPPYSGTHKAQFIQKALEAAENGLDTWMVLPSSTETNWFQNACDKAQLVWIVGKRIPFIKPDTMLPDPNPRNASAVFLFGPPTERYYWSESKQLLQSLMKTYGGFCIVNIPGHPISWKIHADY